MTRSLELNLEDFIWHDKAACKGRMGRDFDPMPTERSKAFKEASFCHEHKCPVMKECLAMGMHYDHSGVHGGEVLLDGRVIDGFKGKKPLYRQAEDQTGR